MKKYIVLCQPILTEVLRGLLDKEKFTIISGQFLEVVKFIEIPE